MTRRSWSEEEVAFLKEHYKEFAISCNLGELSDRMNRSVNSLICEAQKLGLSTHGKDRTVPPNVRRKISSILKDSPKVERVCQQCSQVFKVSIIHANARFCSRECYLKTYYADKEKIKEQRHRWYMENKEKLRGRYPEISKRARIKLRRRVLEKITGSVHPKCVYCGCDNFQVLQINHKNLGGRKDYTKYNGERGFYFAILGGKRSVDDLEIVCGVCNTRHYIKEKYGVDSWEIKWQVN